MPLDIDHALIALVPDEIDDTLIRLYTIIGALVRDRDEEHARAEQFIDALVKAGEIAGYSVDKKPCGIQTLNEYLEALVRKRDELLIAANRYETVRKLNPRQFSELYERNITSGQRFDDLVDALAVNISDEIPSETVGTGH